MKIFFRFLKLKGQEIWEFGPKILGGIGVVVLFVAVVVAGITSIGVCIHAILALFVGWDNTIPWLQTIEAWPNESRMPGEPWFITFVTDHMWMAMLGFTTVAVSIVAIMIIAGIYFWLRNNWKKAAQQIRQEKN